LGNSASGATQGIVDTGLPAWAGGAKMLNHVGIYQHEEHAMSEKGASPEKKQGQSDEARRLRAWWYRAAGLSEDAIAELIREPAADTESTTVRARRNTTGV